MMESDGRKHPPHQPVREAFNLPIIVFLTVITKGRKPVLADTEAHLSLLNAWRAAKTWLVGRYVVMPDHVHLFCSPAALVPEPLIKWSSF
jgi:REP element-mobilizing transposase RayT